MNASPGPVAAPAETRSSAAVRSSLLASSIPPESAQPLGRKERITEDWQVILVCSALITPANTMLAGSNCCHVVPDHTEAGTVTANDPENPGGGAVYRHHSLFTTDSSGARGTILPEAALLLSCRTGSSTAKSEGCAATTTPAALGTIEHSTLL